MTADIEFDSARKCRAFEPPKWMGREISGSKIYANRALARRGGLPPKGRKN
jgi:CYTH domain-containing protein